MDRDQSRCSYQAFKKAVACRKEAVSLKINVRNKKGTTGATIWKSRLGSSEAKVHPRPRTASGIQNQRLEL